ncbi:MAG TPA: glycosyltransferase family 2 protein [Niabella sp.]|nr:glycosyltransferase family 2 protein [Niabella sp.]HQW14878.1 glycosyltransferase family 2 protein [Niabella sp.]HQX18497.1 glycosyltransferase family 2 protein [Niabella sp.]HQX41495.1 glycosyltransferase family 2 protein [Niabella sp.]HRB06024.1 glycosyltransferase family 2 protein [Niabella sp.]
MLSIIYINYNSTDFILQSIKSLYQYGLNIPHEIIVVNNSPEDLSVIEIKKNFENTLLLETGYNAGFARANNCGLELASGDIVLLLNPDTYVVDNSIEQLYLSFSSSDLGAATLQLYFEDGSKQLSAFYNVKGGLNTLLPLPGVGTILRKINNGLRIKKTYADTETPQMVEVDWIHGACLMFRKEILKITGSLDEDFFLYSEEIEWCGRIKKQYKIGFYNYYKLIHLEGKSSGQLFNNKQSGYLNVYGKKGLQLMLSNLVRIRKEFGSGWFLLHLLTYTMTIPLLFLMRVFDKKTKPLDFAKNVKYLIGKAPVILANKPYFYKVL